MYDRVRSKQRSGGWVQKQQSRISVHPSIGRLIFHVAWQVEGTVAMLGSRSLCLPAPLLFSRPPATYIKGGEERGWLRSTAALLRPPLQQLVAPAMRPLRYCALRRLVPPPDETRL